MHEDRKTIQLHAATPAPLLIAAVTGRALAASARRGGYSVVVLDYFADRDCAAHAVACRSVVARGALRFDRRALLSAAAELTPSGQCGGLIYGSGFEARPTLLRTLAAGRRLYGNRPDVVRALKDPQHLSSLFHHLAIPFPETTLTPPRDPVGWLVKRIGGAGGTHVRPAATEAAPGRSYFQRLVPGQIYSVLFVANGRQSRVLGWNRQWTSQANLATPYLFGGAVGGVVLPTTVIREISAAIDNLVEATGLVGINGLDFVLRGRTWTVLEVNPRPTATMELYDPDYPRGLFACHLAACDGRLPAHIPTARASRALAIIQAPNAWNAADFRFPAWCRDIPLPSISFQAGDPVCTVHASGPDPDTAMRLVQQRRARLLSLIGRSLRPAAV